MSGEIHQQERIESKRGIYAKGIELAIRIVEVLERNRDLILAREQIFSNHPAHPKSREIATVITNEVGRRWGVLNEIIEVSQNEPLSQSSQLLRAALRVCSYLVYFERKNPFHVVNLLRNYILGKTKEGFLRRLFFVLRKVVKFKAKEVCTPLDYAYWYLFFPRWIAEKMINDFGQDEAFKLMEEMNRIPHMTIRTNTRFISPDELFAKLQKNYRFLGEVSPVYPFIRLEKIYPVMRTEEYEKGLFTVQDENTALGVIRLMEMLPAKSKVLDACAAPGRKSSFIVQERPDVELYCVDISLGRLKKLVADFERLRLELPHIVNADASRPPFKTRFDAVIADLPCSGSGTWGKHPERKWFTSPDRYKECVRIQRSLLEVLTEYLKEGGILLYSTCSIWREENEENTKWLTEKFGYQLIEEKRIFPEKASTGFYYSILKKP